MRHPLKNWIFFLSYFFVGALCFLAGTQFPLDLPTANLTDDKHHSNSAHDQPFSAPKKKLDESESPRSTEQKSTRQKVVNPKISALEKIVENVDDNELSSVLNRFFSSDEIQYIDNPRAFSRRLIEELKVAETPINENSFSHSYVSQTKEYSEIQETDLYIKKRETLYAHIDTQQGLGSSTENIFVRWTRARDNKVLLFEKKSVLPDSDKNWVSFTPNTNWEEGAYDVAFFTFDSQLQKLTSSRIYLHLKN